MTFRCLKWTFYGYGRDPQKEQQTGKHIPSSRLPLTHEGDRERCLRGMDEYLTKHSNAWRWKG